MPLCSSSGGGFHLIVNEVEVTSASDTFTGGELGTVEKRILCNYEYIFSFHFKYIYIYIYMHKYYAYII